MEDRIIHRVCFIILFAPWIHSETSISGVFCDTPHCFCEQRVITCYQIPDENMLKLLETNIPTDYRHFVIRLMEDTVLDADRLHAVFPYFTEVETFHRGQRYRYVPPTPRSGVGDIEEKRTTEHFTAHQPQRSTSPPVTRHTPRLPPHLDHVTVSPESPSTAHAETFPVDHFSCIDREAVIQGLWGYIRVNRILLITTSGLILLCVMTPSLVKVCVICRRRRENRGYLGGVRAREVASRQGIQGNGPPARPSNPPIIRIVPPPRSNSPPSDLPPAPPPPVLPEEEEHIYEKPEPIMTHKDVCKKLCDPPSGDPPPTLPPREEFQMHDFTGGVSSRPITNPACEGGASGGS